jgi:hypothetical protein
MGNINCRKARREIEAAAGAEFLNIRVRRHLSSCAACKAVLREQTSLLQLVSSLGTVSAPDDFDFRLRARLAREKQELARPLAGNLLFGLRSGALATILLLVGSALMFVSFRTYSGNQTNPEPTAKNAGGAPEKAAVAKSSEPQAMPPVRLDNGTDEAIVAAVPRANKARPRSQSGRFEAGNRQSARDLSGTRAQVYQAADFPIDAGYQSLKVSVDEGRGTSRTISLPAVSFGSQRSLSQNPTPLLASARDTW